MCGLSPFKQYQKKFLLDEEAASIKALPSLGESITFSDYKVLYICTYRSFEFQSKPINVIKCIQKSWLEIRYSISYKRVQYG